MHRKVLANVFGMLFATLAVMPAANAIPITEGEIVVRTPSTGRGTFSFSVSESAVTGSYDEGTQWKRPGYYAGESFEGNQSLSGGIIDFFHGYVDSQFLIWHNTVSPIKSMLNTWAAGAQLVQGQTVYRSSFDFQGTLCGSVSYNAPICDVVFDLSGQGIAEFFFNESVLEDGRHLFTATNARYTFTPVPEPTTLALFGLGLLGVMTARRANRRH